MQSSEVRRGRPRNSGRRKEELLEKLERIFLRHGFRSITIDYLATELRCSKKTLYNIAPSKEEIFLVVMDKWLSEIRRKGWQQASGQQVPRDRIQAFLHPGIEGVVDTTQSFWADVESYMPAKSMLTMHQRDRMHSIVDMIQVGIEDGSFHKVHPYLIAEVLLSAILRFDSPDFLESSGLSIGEAFQELYDVVFRGIEI